MKYSPHGHMTLKMFELKFEKRAGFLPRSRALWPLQVAADVHAEDALGGAAERTLPTMVKVEGPLRAHKFQDVAVFHPLASAPRWMEQFGRGARGLVRASRRISLEPLFARHWFLGWRFP
jgi:hypothetical protein